MFKKVFYKKVRKRPRSRNGTLANNLGVVYLPRKCVGLIAKVEVPIIIKGIHWR